MPAIAVRILDAIQDLRSFTCRYPSFLVFMGKITEIQSSGQIPNFASHCPVWKTKADFCAEQGRKLKEDLYSAQCWFFFFFHKPNTSTPTQHWKLHTHFSPKSIFLHARAPSSQNTTTYQILLLFIRRVFSLLNRGNPSSLRISLSEKSIASNWSRVAPKFSITGIL